ncbi:ribonuclease HI [Pseudobutyrivibrio sp. 49]|uniref:ribonuclease H1 domain-containing protein n=1 Tax=unclassified Pseudobutyrivibrio TaxID=2638619 RepID=UPI00088A6037|nr:MULTISPECIES: ribonuclease H family protein [unclassified Pseudobutyrivibrio]SDI05253.1 ribonuclease HI [Pseudobutyrivibrio sp. 49]SFO25812.1 ribonuclease HI [Pseudobutyrivibrio sp. UC1225]
MAKKNYYAVKVGKVPGIYKTWPECQSNTSGFPGAVFKGFETLEEAEAFMTGTASTVAKSEADGVTSLPDIYAFTDGSFNVATGVYGYGGFLHYSDVEEDIEIRGNGNDPEEAVSRNVAGEVHGAVAAMRKAVELGLSEMTLFYDYEGIEKWPLRYWKTNKKISMFYVEEYDQLKDSLKVNFVHVKAHTGIPGNEAADRMAKAEVGIE